MCAPVCVSARGCVRSCASAHAARQINASPLQHSTATKRKLKPTSKQQSIILERLSEGRTEILREKQRLSEVQQGRTFSHLSVPRCYNAFSLIHDRTVVWCSLPQIKA